MSQNRVTTLLTSAAADRVDFAVFQEECGRRERGAEWGTQAKRGMRVKPVTFSVGIVLRRRKGFDTDIFGLCDSRRLRNVRFVRDVQPLRMGVERSAMRNE